ncbi:alpha/beta hydrolase [Mycobacterium sp. OTB74]|uniref:alpha/beta hydrolase n=1 Tax=Mycobacterium sp. OTB74 TaxID=1853452 RepID=UPI0024740D06|nr:alpha/beta hydrolase [Mycobacterium sp. OTB74]MDH6244466.1 pimeloyl-ACP methyl ester carboxylesterase [Mycobacterium sp. OTB74]
MTTSMGVRAGRVTTEGDDLYYEVRGQGSPLLMIPPAGGDGWSYAHVAEILANEYKVITFDRRANARSTINDPQNFEISQQSRDAAAVLRAAGEQSAVVFGNSSGAVIALDMARTQRRAVQAVVAHEAPLARLHPQARKWQRFFANVYATGFRFGTSLAALRFMFGVELPVRQMIKATKNVNRHRTKSTEPYVSERQATDVLIKLELLPVTNYLPDFDGLKRGDATAFVGVSEYGLTRNAWYAQVAQILARRLDCDLITFPGHHVSFMDTPDEFAAVLRDVMHRAANTVA